YSKVHASVRMRSDSQPQILFHETSLKNISTDVELVSSANQAQIVADLVAGACPVIVVVSSRYESRADRKSTRDSQADALFKTTAIHLNAQIATGEQRGTKYNCMKTVE